VVVDLYYSNAKVRIKRLKDLHDGIVENTTLQTPWYRPLNRTLRLIAPVRASLKTCS
jgi:hypothetical protein